MPNPGNIVKHKFKKGQSGNPNGRPKKLPDLDDLLANIFGEDKMEKVLRAIYTKALRGDTRAAEIILERGYGKVKQAIDSTVKAEQTIKVIYDGGINNLIEPNTPS